AFQIYIMVNWKKRTTDAYEIPNHGRPKIFSLSEIQKMAIAEIRMLLKENDIVSTGTKSEIKSINIIYQYSRKTLLEKNLLPDLALKNLGRKVWPTSKLEIVEWLKVMFHKR
ncbi:14030_t:CDS:2, partial [Entrophospora sp. SA101]